MKKSITSNPLLESYLMPKDSAALRFYGLGFQVVDSGEIRYPMDADDANNMPEFMTSVTFQVDFLCVCGKREQFRAVGIRGDFEQGYRNFFSDLQRAGAMGREHLLRDGYAEATVDAMERRCEGFIAGVRAQVHVPLFHKVLNEAGEHLSKPLRNELIEMVNNGRDLCRAAR